MSKVDEALEIIQALGFPRQQQNERSALTLLALAGISPKGKWNETSQQQLRVWDIMGFMREKYRKDYAANTRETIRRQTLHQFEQARVVDRNRDDPTRPTNSGKNVYCLTDAVVPVLQAYRTRAFDGEITKFIQAFGQLSTAYAKARALQQVQLRLPDGKLVALSPGKHNALQAAVIEHFGPRFAPGAQVIYLGDTAKKQVHLDGGTFDKLRIEVTEHDKLPDVVLFDASKEWLYLIEAVTSHGPFNPKRHAEIQDMLASCSAATIFVTAFLTRADFRKWAGDIAWETEVWIAESPDHMIHFNGPKFLGPYQKT
jgi:hypothetical protein